MAFDILHRFQYSIVFQVQFFSRKSNYSMFLVDNGVVIPQESAFPENRDIILRAMDEKWDEAKSVFEDDDRQSVPTAFT